jgi:hypothetical protein
LAEHGVVSVITGPSDDFKAFLVGLPDVDLQIVRSREPARAVELDEPDTHASRIAPMDTPVDVGNRTIGA